MEKFGKAQPVKRVEVCAVLTGEGRYVDGHRAWPTRCMPISSASPVRRVITARVADAAEQTVCTAVLTIKDWKLPAWISSRPQRCCRNRNGQQGAKPVRPHACQGPCAFVGNLLRW